PAAASTCSTKFPPLKQRSAICSSCDVNCVRTLERPEPESQSPIFVQRGTLPGLPSNKTAMSAAASLAAALRKRGQKSLGAPENWRSADNSSNSREKFCSIIIPQSFWPRGRDESCHRHFQKLPSHARGRWRRQRS